MLKFGNDIIKYDNNWLNEEEPIEPLPPITGNVTIRVQFTDKNYDFGADNTYTDRFIVTKVASNPNVWDVTLQPDPWLDYPWSDLFSPANYYPDSSRVNLTNLNGLFDVIDCSPNLRAANINYLFYNNTKLRSCIGLPLQNLYPYQGGLCYMFAGCTNLIELPNFDYANIYSSQGESLLEEDIQYLYDGCVNVQSGILREYNKLSALFPNYSDNKHPFRNCGSNTITGSAELAQIPNDWK